MGLDRCTPCDQGRHGDCNGSVTVMDQDGPSRYVCRCSHRQATLERQRIESAVRRVRRLMAETGLNRTHDLTPKNDRPGAEP